MSENLEGFFQTNRETKAKDWPSFNVQFSPLLKRVCEIDLLGLPVRDRNALVRGGVTKIIEAASLSNQELLGIRQFGSGSIKRLRRSLGEFQTSLIEERVRQKLTQDQPVELVVKKLKNSSLFRSP